MRTGILLIALIMLSGCDPQSQGFSLPPGDVERGRSTFVELGCPACHRVIGDDELGTADPNAEMQIDLGGRVSRIRSYGDLVTSVINPSHRISIGGPGTSTEDGESTMRVYNDVMTVQQLVDLVTYLQSSYEIFVPQTQYPIYP